MSSVQGASLDLAISESVILELVSAARWNEPRFVSLLPIITRIVVSIFRTQVHRIPRSAERTRVRMSDAALNRQIQYWVTRSAVSKCCGYVFRVRGKFMLVTAALVVGKVHQLNPANAIATYTRVCVELFGRNPDRIVERILGNASIVYFALNQKIKWNKTFFLNKEEDEEVPAEEAVKSGGGGKKSNAEDKEKAERNILKR